MTTPKKRVMSGDNFGGRRGGGGGNGKGQCLSGMEGGREGERTMVIITTEYDHYH